MPSVSNYPAPRLDSRPVETFRATLNPLSTIMVSAGNEGANGAAVRIDGQAVGALPYRGTTTPGLTRSLLTEDDAVLTLSYGTTKPDGTQWHTGVQVPLAATGPGAEGLVGVLDQTEIFTILRDALELDGP